MLSRLVSFIDRLSGATGLVGVSLVLPIAAVMFYEVVLRFFFDLFGGSDKPLIRTVFTGEQDERMSGRSTLKSFSFQHFNC